MAPNQPLRVATLPLYGILVTERSWLLGQRRLVKSYYAHTLVRRVLGRRLPGELINQIADDLTELEYADLKKLWTALKDKLHHRETLFQLPAMGGTEVEQSAARELRSLSHGMLSGKVEIAKPDGANMRYMHISASKNKPNLIHIVPGGAPEPDPPVPYADGHVRVHITRGSPSAISRERVHIEPNTAGSQVGRLVLIDGIEDAIKWWDYEAVEQYVKFLNLHVVSMSDEEGEELTPRLRFLQTIEWM